NEITWIDWEGVDLDGEEPDGLLGYVRFLARLRREHPVFRRRRFFRGSPVEGSSTAEDGLPDIAWLRPDGKHMSGGDWGHAGQALVVFLNGDAITETDTGGRRIRYNSCLWLIIYGSIAWRVHSRAVA